MQCCYKRVRILEFSVSVGSPGPRSLGPLFIPTRFTVMKQTTVCGKNLEWWEKFRVVTKIGENRKPFTTIYPPIAKLTGSKMLGAIGHLFLKYSQQDSNFL